jgi:hypothetical protein
MDASKMYDAFLGALSDHAKKQAEDESRLTSGMIPIAPFDAETIDDERVRVVGIVSNVAHDMLDFVVIKTMPGGEMIPTTEGSLWPVP